MKPTHGSGAVVVVSPAAPADARLPGPGPAGSTAMSGRRRSTGKSLAAVGRRVAGAAYGQGPNQEWAYGPVPRQILVEELLVGPDGGIPDDYKFFVFHQRCASSRSTSAASAAALQDFFTDRVGDGSTSAAGRPGPRHRNRRRPGWTR